MSESFCYPYPRPAVTVDVVCCKEQAGPFEIVLIKRRYEPYENCWALPGGFIEIDEELDDAAKRELYEETHLKTDFIKQFHTFGKLGRDPRGRTISVGYLAIVSKDMRGFADSDAKELAWFPIDQLPPLAFDHTCIIKMAITHIAQWQKLGIWPLKDVLL